MEYGVIVGKFQAPMLTEGHKQILSTAGNKSDHLLIFIFDNEIPFSSSNPLSYDVRERILLDFVRNKVCKHATFYKLSDQKYASSLQNSIDKTLSYYDIGGKNTATIYGGPNNFANDYTGIANKVILPLVQGKNSSELRDMAYNLKQTTLLFHSGMINALNWREPICHNFIVPLVTSNEKGPVLLVEQLTTMKNLTIPTFPVVARFDDLIHQSRAELKDIFPELKFSSGSLLGSIKINDWRFRDTEDFCYYHLVYHRADYSDAPEGLKWLGHPLNSYLFEEEYHPLLPYINKVI